MNIHSSDHIVRNACRHTQLPLFSYREMSTNQDATVPLITLIDVIGSTKIKRIVIL